MTRQAQHGFACICGECAKAQRPLKLAAMRAVQDAINEAQKQQRAYSWHRCYSLAMGARS
jgi:hypothetical protein